MRITYSKRHAVLSMLLFLFIIFAWPRPGEAVGKISLDKDLKYVGTRLLPAGEIIVLEAADVSKDIESVFLTIKRSYSTFPIQYLKSIEFAEGGQRVWRVEIGPFLPRSQVQILMEIIKPISAANKKAMEDIITEVFKITASDIVVKFPDSMTENAFKTNLKDRFLGAIKAVEVIKTLRTKTGESLEKSVEDLFAQEEFGNALSNYLQSFQDISYLESVFKENLSELKGIVKGKKYGAQLTKEKDEKKRKVIEEFWTKIAEGQWTSADLAKKPEEEIITALEFGKKAGISDHCPAYADALIKQPRNIQKNKEKCAAITILVIQLASAEVGNLRQMELESLDLEVREIEHWAGFNVGYLACARETKNVLPAFIIDIHPCRFSLEDESLSWEKEYYWKRFSLSAGIGLSKPDRSDLADRWYFVGIGFRLNPFFRFHIGDAIFFSTNKEEDGTIKEKGWRHTLAMGLSLNIRELSHVLAFFGGIKSGQNEKE